jgi:hypothetical protein
MAPKQSGDQKFRAKPKEWLTGLQIGEFIPKATSTHKKNG